MANYYATARTNYFKVKDVEKFKELCEHLDVQFIQDGDKVGFLCSHGDQAGFPSYYWDEETQEYVDIDLLSDISKHLVKGEVAVLMEAGAEKFRYITGYAQAVNSEGDVCQITLDDIYKKAQEELGGENITTVEY
jgi:hypothetical protein